MVNRELLYSATNLIDTLNANDQVIHIDGVYQNARRGTKAIGRIGPQTWDIWLWHFHGIHAPSTLLVPRDLIPHRGPQGEVIGSWGHHNKHNIIYVGNEFLLDPPCKGATRQVLDYARLRLAADARFRFFSDSRRAISQYYASAIAQLTGQPYAPCEIPMEKQLLDHFRTTRAIPDDFHHSRLRAWFSTLFRGR